MELKFEEFSKVETDIAISYYKVVQEKPRIAVYMHQMPLFNTGYDPFVKVMIGGHDTEITSNHNMTKEQALAWLGKAVDMAKEYAE